MNSYLLDLFTESPERALSHVFSLRKPYELGVRMYTYCKGIDGKHYGSSKLFIREMLLGRRYEIHFISGKLAIKFTDRVYNPKTFSHEVCGA